MKDKILSPDKSIPLTTLGCTCVAASTVQSNLLGSCFRENKSQDLSKKSEKKSFLMFSWAMSSEHPYVLGEACKKLVRGMYLVILSGATREAEIDAGEGCYCCKSLKRQNKKLYNTSYMA